MTPVEQAIVIATGVAFVALGAFGLWQGVHIPWPRGARTARMTVLGTEVVTIDLPGGSDGERLLLLDACATAVVATFSAWKAWRPSSNPPESVFTTIGIQFISDELMDDIEVALFPNRGRVFAYLTNCSSRFREIPLVMVRVSCVPDMITTGQPLIHELVHVLLNRFAPTEEGIHDHTHEAWALVQYAARGTYLDLYAPKS